MNKTNDDFCNEILNKFAGNIVVLDKYVDEHTKINFHCNRCNIDFLTSPQSILHTTYGCKECGKKSARQKLIRKNIEISGRLVDKYPNIAKQWDYDKNLNIDINDITPKSGQKVWWVCTQCGKSYQAKVCAIVNGTGNCVCHNCYVKSLPQVKVDTYVKNKGSFVEHYPNLFKEWCYDLNIDIDLTKLTDKSNKRVWWKCNVCGHKWLAKIAKRTAGEGCPYCARHTKSALQIKIEDYIKQQYNYQLLNEHNCTLKCYNPNTGYRLPYDNEIMIDDTIHLIIECHGEQHYCVCGWVYTQAKAENCSTQEILDYQQWKDNYKKEYALDNGYHYLEIPYWTEHDESYKTLIDSKIHEILTLTQQND